MPPKEQASPQRRTFGLDLYFPYAAAVVQLSQLAIIATKH